MNMGTDMSRPASLSLTPPHSSGILVGLIVIEYAFTEMSLIAAADLKNELLEANPNMTDAAVATQALPRPWNTYIRSQPRAHAAAASDTTQHVWAHARLPPRTPTCMCGCRL